MTLRTQLTDLVDRVPLPGEILGAMAVGAVLQRVRPLSLPHTVRPAGILCAAPPLGAPLCFCARRGAPAVVRYRNSKLRDRTTALTQ